MARPKKNAAVNEEVKTEVTEEKKSQKRGRKKTAVTEEMQKTRTETKDIEEKTEPVKRRRRTKAEMAEAEKEEKTEPVKRRRRRKTEMTETEQEIKTTEKTSNKMEITTVVQYRGNEIEQKEMIAKVEEAWRAEGNTVPIRDITMYVKPEDGKIYYVVNGLAGSCDLF